MKNRIWRNWKTAGAVFVMTCSLLMGSGSIILGADGNEQETVILEETEKLPENIEETENAGGADLTASDVVLEEPEEMNPSGNSRTEQETEAEGSEQVNESEMSEATEITETPAPSDIPPFADPEEKEQIPSYKMWITPQQEQIKAGKELLYTITVENTGNCTLKNIHLQAGFSDTTLEGAWEEAESIEIDGKILKLEKLETGIKKEFYFSAQLPETQSGKLCLYLNGNAEYEVEKTGEIRSLVSTEQSSETEVLPLKVDFQVTKTADRTMAVPGDKVTFQICIRNTGERTLHSVVTTEKFQLQNVPVKFLEAEGVILNKDRTKAKIEKIEPGCSVGLLAEVILPEKLKDEKLVNEVTVTTAETGERKVTSKAELQVYKTAETPTPVLENTDDEGTAEQNTETQSKAASTHPKTGDPMNPVLWFLMIPGSLLMAGWVRSRMQD